MKEIGINEINAYTMFLINCVDLYILLTKRVIVKSVLLSC